MQPVTREQLKKIFKKVKKLHLSQGLETVNFSNLCYYSWPDESSQRLYVIYDYKQASTGLKLDYLKASSAPLRLGFCEFCNKHRKSYEVLFVSAETKRRPKHVNYQVRGTWICADYQKCNRDLKDNKNINDFFYRMLEKE